ncbi:DUF4390 domain-containing protein [Massilia horti]|uniref:DUF4390 domain-containing protein n=1 Tax=Massilia horti TaxID=2562153 RepID=A0A4Y9SZ21_9BURK|nr:DUF4390 domain-containing protein [Massilia horti]TFW29976.1 DUF4390 domain-containing protein [Massilia horti]
MTLRFFRLLACQLLLALACAQAQAADTIEITRSGIEASDEGYRLNAEYSFELNHGLIDAIQRGVRLYFTTEIELTRPRWWWRDDKAVSTRQTVNIVYDMLTRQYHVSVPGSVKQSFSTLDEALFTIRRPSRWLIAPKGALKPGETYNVSLRMFMDRDYLQKPLQVNALNNSDWRLASNKKTFTYKAE